MSILLANQEIENTRVYQNKTGETIENGDRMKWQKWWAWVRSRGYAFEATLWRPRAKATGESHARIIMGLSELLFWTLHQAYFLSKTVFDTPVGVIGESSG